MTCTVNTDGHDTPGGAHGRKLDAPDPLEFGDVYFHVLHSAVQVHAPCISLRICAKTSIQVSPEPGRRQQSERCFNTSVAHSCSTYLSSDRAQHLEAFHQDVHGEADGVRLCTLAHRTVEEVERATRVQPELHACMCARVE